MGQYYQIINIDKRERIHPHHLDNGAKLMEWCYVGNEMTNALMNKLRKDWRGDRVYIVGDYADLSDRSEYWANAYEEAITELNIADTVNHDGVKIDSLYKVGYADEDSEQYVKDISKDVCTKGSALRYIVNRKFGKYIDITHCPTSRTGINEEDGTLWNMYVHPLPLLIAMGNNRGGGDYRENSPGFEYVGSWCDSVRWIEVYEKTKEIHGFESMSEFMPNFGIKIYR